MDRYLVYLKSFAAIPNSPRQSPEGVLVELLLQGLERLDNCLAISKDIHRHVVRVD